MCLLVCSVCLCCILAPPLLEEGVLHIMENMTCISTYNVHNVYTYVYGMLVFQGYIIIVLLPAGSSVQGCIINLIGLHSPEKPVLNSITGLLDIRLLVHLIIIGSFIHLSWSFTLRLFRIYQTQVHISLSTHLWQVVQSSPSSDKECLWLQGWAALGGWGC